MRMGKSDFNDASGTANDGTSAGSEPSIIDWLNLPDKTQVVALWDCLHDAEIVSVRSNLLERTMRMTCEIEHLRDFHKLGEGFHFILHLGGVQSARVQVTRLTGVANQLR